MAYNRHIKYDKGVGPLTTKHNPPFKHTGPPLPLLSLPCEILAQILLNLDSFSLRAFLKAFPVIARRCILLYQYSSTGYSLPCFFTDGNIPSMDLNDFVPKNNRYLLKIYEAQIPLYKIRKRQTECTLDLPHLSSEDSYVHCFLGNLEGIYTDHKTLVVHTFARYFNEKGISFQFDRFRERSVVVTNPIHCTKQRIKKVLETPCFKGIRFLTIEHCRVIQNLYVPVVSSLTIVFPSSTSIHDRPILSNVKMPLIDRLAIYYDDIPPLIERIKVTPYSLGYSPYANLGQLVVCYRPALASNLTSPLAAFPARLEALVNFKCLNPHGEFTTVVIIGGPDVIVNQLIHPNIRTLSWKQTNYQLSPVTTIYDTSEVFAKFSFESLLPNAIYPYISHPNISVLPYSIAIVSHNGIDLSNLQCNSEMERILVHCYNRSENPKQMTPRSSDIPVLVDGTLAGRLKFLSIDGLINSYPITEDPKNDPVIGESGLISRFLNYAEVRNYKQEAAPL